MPISPLITIAAKTVVLHFGFEVLIGELRGDLRMLRGGRVRAPGVAGGAGDP